MKKSAKDKNSVKKTQNMHTPYFSEVSNEKLRLNFVFTFKVLRHMEKFFSIATDKENIESITCKFVCEGPTNAVSGAGYYGPFASEFKFMPFRQRTLDRISIS